ncbi:MAG: P-loop NTPase family protein, partial [Candidatus Humimicrobiaceae bacterium]
VIEPPILAPAIFNWIGIEEREVKNTGQTSSVFYSYPHEISYGNKLKNKAEYIYDNIVWIIADDRKEKIKTWQYNHMLQLVYASSIAPITFIDVGDSIFHESVKPLLSTADFVFVVIDPFPTICKISNDKFLELLKLKSEGCPVHFIINKWNSGIEEKEFLSFIGVKPLALIPAIDLSILYKANCQYKISLCYPEVSNLLEGTLNNICSLFIPKEFMGSFSKNKKEKGRTMLANILKKFIKTKIKIYEVE